MSLQSIVDHPLKGNKKKIHIAPNSLRSSVVTKRREEDRHIPGFRDIGKVYGVSNATLPLVITVTIVFNWCHRFLLMTGVIAMSFTPTSS